MRHRSNKAPSLSTPSHPSSQPQEFDSSSKAPNTIKSAFLQFFHHATTKASASSSATVTGKEAAKESVDEDKLLHIELESSSEIEAHIESGGKEIEYSDHYHHSDTMSTGSQTDESRPFLQKQTTIYTPQSDNGRTGIMEEDIGDGPLAQQTGDHTAITINSETAAEVISDEAIGIGSKGIRAVLNAMEHDPNMVEQEAVRDYDRRSMLKRLFDWAFRRRRHYARTAFLNGTLHPAHTSTPKNVVRNQKYSILFFVPQVLYEQFKYFFNLYFLIVALTQFIPPLKVGFLFTYVAPLVFVLGVTMLKEAYDDIKRWKRDKEANSQKYERLTLSGVETIPSSRIRVGDLIILHTDQRVPADCILLRTTEKSAASFVRTDQLDGETDWKLRHAVPICQKLRSDMQLLNMTAAIYAEKPKKEIYDFVGTFTRYDPSTGKAMEVDSLNLENTLWSNCVVASGTVVAMVIYTGKETRSVMNTSSPSSKMGKLDMELNTISKFLFIFMCVLSVLLVAFNRFQGKWYINIFRFFLLFSAIIPISMRVNLDMGKTIYSFFIMRDKKIPGTVVRNSSLPEELGRIDYLFSDKTGTLTQNEMVFKKIHMGHTSFTEDRLVDIAEHVKRFYTANDDEQEDAASTKYTVMRPQSIGTHDIQSSMVTQMIQALSLCHNVTPVTNEEGNRDYQASSPDEIALVKFSETVGLTLVEREHTSITVRGPTDQLEHYDILNIFPFTSEAKRMGIFVRSKDTNVIEYFMKGADTVMSKAVRFSDWLEEECDNMAREGLRTLVFAKKTLTEEEYEVFQRKYNEAKASIRNRSKNIEAVRKEFESNMDLLGVTGVEDKLQEDVQTSLENLHNAGIKIWMLTGDKVETAICIARSTRLVSRIQPIFTLIADNKRQAEELLNEFSQLTDAALVIDGATLQICIDEVQKHFLDVATTASAVVCCRCSPTQKAVVVQLVKNRTKKRCAAIGDGGNDVSMIQQADCGLGIVGKEGKQAALAADFSIDQFAYVTRLLMWHGRNSYKRSARLSQFIIHRGLIISFIQAVFSAVYFFATIPVFTGWLLVGYSTFYTMLPVFSIVVDEDVKESNVVLFPELYAELKKGRALNLKSFLVWLWMSIYQGGVIMLLAIFLFENSFLRIVSISFTALILTELLMVILEVHKVKIWMIFAEVVSILIYAVSVFLLPSYFDIPFILSFHFWWRVIAIVLLSTAPIYIVKFIVRRIAPPSYTKLN